MLPYSKDSVVALFKNQPYEFAPGTRWAYNNSAFFLLGCIVEKVSGQSYGAFIDTFMLQKAEMRNTGLNNLDSILKNRAAGYQKINKGWKNAAYISMEFPFSAGAMYSTAEDLYKWNKALYGGKILSANSLQQMTTPGMNHYGLGLRIDSFYNYKRIGHSGTIPGFESHNAWFPAEDLSIILLTNNESNLNELSEDIEAILLKKQKIVIDTSILNAFAGTYRSSDNIKFTFSRCGNSLCFVDGDSLDKLQPTSRNTFFYGFTRRRYFTFIKDQNGKIKLQFVRNGNLTSEFEKVY
jgi:CubicO group peptidase (beta-lactamase class C family)